MKLVFGLVLVLMVLVSACAQEVQVAEEVQVDEPAEQTIEEVAAEPVDQIVEETEVVMEEPVEEAIAGGDIQIMAKEGFDPSELTVASGSSVTWTNTGDKIVTLTFFKDGKFFLNSEQINSGKSFEYSFEEAGDYEYWTIQYGVKANLIVE